MNTYVWTINSDLTGIDLTNMHTKSCYSDDCLFSTYYRDEILDFLEDNHNVTVIKYELDRNYCYIVKFNATIEQFNNLRDEIMTFYTGRFTSAKIELNGEIIWIADNNDYSTYSKDKMTFRIKRAERFNEMLKSSFEDT